MSKIIGGLFGGGQKAVPSQTVNTTSQPPEYLVPYLRDLANEAKGALTTFKTQNLATPFQGQRVAGKTAEDTLALEKALQAANMFDNSGAVDKTYGFANTLANKVAGGAFTAPGNMAFDSGSYDLTGKINSAINPVLQNFQERLVPQLKSAAIESGAYGGSKFNEAGARLARDTQDTAARIAADVGYQDFQNKRQLDQNDLAQRRNLLLAGQQAEIGAADAAGSLFNKALSMGLQPSDIFGKVGEKERAFTQQDIDVEREKYADRQNEPWAGLDDFMSLIKGVSGQAGRNQSQTTMGYQPSSTGFLQGLMGAGSAIGTVGGMLGLPSLPTIGMNLGLPAGIVNGLASFGSLFSDERLKENIVLVGNEKGHNLYSFNYKLQPNVRYVGVMAQEVMKKVPEAVKKVGDYLAVNYEMLGIEFRRI